MDHVPCLKKKDHLKTKAELLMREDDVLVIWYPDGTRFTQHADGTQILTHPNGDIVVDHPDYSTVTISSEK